MSKPNFSGTYTLVSSSNEDAFMKAQGIGWVLRKAAKAVGSNRVAIRHVDKTFHIKAGLLDLAYEIDAAPWPVSKRARGGGDRARTHVRNCGRAFVQRSQGACTQGRCASGWTIAHA